MKKQFLLATIILLMFPTFAFSEDVMVTRNFTGLWDQPEHESQGINLQVISQASGEKVSVAYWFTYGDDRETAWFLGVGTVSGNRIEMLLYEGSGVGFLEHDSPGNDQVLEVGTMEIEFFSCTEGEVTFMTDIEVVGSGVFPIEKFADVFDDNGCDDNGGDDNGGDDNGGDDNGGDDNGGDDNGGDDNGGDDNGGDDNGGDDNGGDDNGGDDNGGGDDGGVDNDFGTTEIEVDLTNMGVFPLASGDAKLEQRVDRTDFSVEIEDVPAGGYDLRIGDNIVGTIQAVKMPDGSIEGELEFRNPQEPGKLPLDFDLRGKQIHVLDVDGTTVVLETLFPSG